MDCIGFDFKIKRIEKSKSKTKIIRSDDFSLNRSNSIREHPRTDPVLTTQGDYDSMNILLKQSQRLSTSQESTKQDSIHLLYMVVPDCKLAHQISTKDQIEFKQVHQCLYFVELKGFLLLFFMIKKGFLLLVP